MKKWRRHFLQEYRSVEAGYACWLLLQFVLFFSCLFVLLSILLLLSGRWPVVTLILFCALMASMLSASRTYADHYALCPARSNDEAYRAVQSSLLIWIIFALGSVFFLSHYASLFFAAALLWGAIYAALLHIRAGRQALKPARDDVLPASFSGVESREYAIGRVLDDILNKRRSDFCLRAMRENWDENDILVKASQEFM